MTISTTTTSLFDAIGGTNAVKTVVADFYKRVLSDPNLSGFFSNTDMVRQTELQVQFVSQALGGPVEYSGRDMKSAHQSLNITEVHFGLVAGHLVEALRTAGVSDVQIEEIVSRIAPLKDEICTA